MALVPRGPWLESFLEMMAVERGAARHTLDAYQRDLADYVVESFIPALLQVLRIPLVAAQNGQVRWYAAAMALGVVWLLAFVLLA